MLKLLPCSVKSLVVVKAGIKTITSHELTVRQVRFVDSYLLSLVLSAYFEAASSRLLAAEL